jgi:hypothetical protein
MNLQQTAYLIAHALNCLPSLEDVEEYGELEGKCCAKCCAPCNALYTLIQSNEINSVLKNYYQDGYLWASDWLWWDCQSSEFDTDYFYARVSLDCSVCRR